MAGVASKGFEIWAEIGSPAAFTKILNLRDVSGPNITQRHVDTTTHSTSGNYTETAAVIIELIKLSFPVNFDNSDPNMDLTSATSLYEICTSLTAYPFQIRTGPHNATRLVGAFSGYVSNHTFQFPVIGIQDAQVEITIDGGITWTEDDGSLDA